MKIFIDTANVDEIIKYANIGFIDGVTTNPALMATEERTALDVIQEIVKIVDGPISVEVVSTDVDGMVKEARHLASLHENIVVKLPAFGFFNIVDLMFHIFVKLGLDRRQLVIVLKHALIARYEHIKPDQLPF